MDTLEQLHKLEIGTSNARLCQHRSFFIITVVWVKWSTNLNTYHGDYNSPSS